MKPGIYTLFQFLALILLLSLPLSSYSDDASNGFYIMLDDIGDEFFQDHNNKYEHCEATIINWAYQAINNLYGERAAKVSFFDPIITAGRKTGFIAEGAGIISVIDVAVIAVDNLYRSDSATEYIQNYIKDATALFIKKAIAKGVGKVAKDHLTKMGVDAEISGTLDIDAVSEALYEIYKDNDDFVNAMRKAWKQRDEAIAGTESIDPVTYENYGGCETKISAIWDKEREQIVITVNSECDCKEALEASAGKDWTPIKEGNLTLVANVYPGGDNNGGLRWTAKTKSLKYGYQCCDGTNYVSRGLTIYPSQQDKTVDDYPDEETDADNNEADNESKPEAKKTPGMSDKKKQYLERQRIKKLCESDFKKESDQLEKDWRNKRSKMKKDFDKQINELTEKFEQQKATYDFDMKKYVHVQSMVDAEEDPSLSYCDDLSKKQERISDDIRFQNKQLINAETRRAECKNNCAYLDKEITKINQQINDLKEDRSEVVSMEKECRKGKKGLKDQLPELKNKKEFEQQRLNEIEKLLDKNKQNKADALKQIDKEYKQAVALLDAQLEDCKKSKDGNFVIPGNIALTTKTPEAYTLSEYKPKPKHSSGSPLLGEWHDGPYAIVEFKDEAGKIAGYWKKIGPIYGARKYQAGDKYIEGGYQDGMLIGQYNYKDVNAMLSCPDHWNQWAPLKLRLSDDGMTLYGEVEDFGIIWDIASNNADVINCRPASNLHQFSLIRATKQSKKEYRKMEQATDNYKMEAEVYEPEELPPIELEPIEEYKTAPIPLPQ